MRILLISLTSILFSFVDKMSAFTLKHTMDRVDYIEDRLNAESKVRKDDFKALFHKIEGIETKIDNVLAKVEMKINTAESNDKTEPVSDEKLKVLLNAFKKEKAHNIRFRREISEDIYKQTEQTIKAFGHIGISLEQISGEIKLLKEETMKYQITSEKTAEEHIRQIEDLQPVINLTEETVKNININVIDVKEVIEETLKNISLNLVNVTQRQRQYMNIKDVCPNHTQEHAEKTKPDVTSVKPDKSYKSCLNLYSNGFKSRGLYEIQINRSEKEKILVWCDMTTDGGGWTVFQRRKDGSVDFYRDWNDYKYGFGELDGEFWLGNDNINFLTDDGETHELRIDLEDHEGNRAYAKYSRFMVGPETTNYKLEVSGFTGNAGDSLENSYTYYIHNGMSFSTKDRDNDNVPNYDCAVSSNGAWWFNNCFSSHLNGLYNNQLTCATATECIVWSTWKSYRHSLKFTEMKLR